MLLLKGHPIRGSFTALWLNGMTTDWPLTLRRTLRSCAKVAGHGATNARAFGTPVRCPGKRRAHRPEVAPWVEAMKSPGEAPFSPTRGHSIRWSTTSRKPRDSTDGGGAASAKACGLPAAARKAFVRPLWTPSRASFSMTRTEANTYRLAVGTTAWSTANLEVRVRRGGAGATTVRACGPP